MYKVFINNLPVFLASFPHELEYDKPLRFVDCASIEKAEEIINDRITKVHHFGIALFYKDVEQLFKWCFEKFKFIEAAGGVVKNAENKFLFIYRNDKWDLPKGKLDKNEARDLAALREVEEECGIHGHSISYELNSSWHVYALKDGKQAIKITYWYLMYYPGEEQLIPQLEEGITKVEWRAANDIDDILANTFCSIVDVIEEGLKQY